MGQDVVGQMMPRTASEQFQKHVMRLQGKEALATGISFQSVVKR
jgi:hypothetical protein